MSMWLHRMDEYAKALSTVICIQDQYMQDRETDLSVAWKNEAYRICVEKERLQAQMGKERQYIVSEIEKAMQAQAQVFGEQVKVRIFKMDAQIRSIERKIVYRHIQSATKAAHNKDSEKIYTKPTAKLDPPKIDIGDLIGELKSLEKEAKRLLIKT